jgi:CheY-like chemotaxis protein
MSGRVLFVDDEPRVLEGMQRSLRNQVEMRTATSGAEGLRQVLTDEERRLHDLSPGMILDQDLNVIPPQLHPSELKK